MFRLVIDFEYCKREYLCCLYCLFFGVAKLVTVLPIQVDSAGMHSELRARAFNGGDGGMGSWVVCI